MSVCPQCGAKNRPEARFCKQCAQALPQCQSSLPSATAPVCPHCGAVLRTGARFCKQCGKSIATAATATTRTPCPRCGAPVRASARFCPLCRAPMTTPTGPATGPRCPKCGTPTRPGARFCRICSRPLSTAPPPLRSPPPPAQKPGRFGTGELLPLTILVGRYVILERIAQGGMGAIYKAQDQRLQGKVVAVKEMSESAIAPSERTRVLESFQREAELLARLEHPSLARVTDRFQEGERHYMVMELIEGQTLEKLMEGRSDPFPEDQVLAWADQLCDVLSYLHSQKPKIIYRDVKPANVMVVDVSGQVKLIDFGIARFFKPGKRKDTIEFGTDGYAPPEQYGKSQTNEQSDIYALGAMLHQLLTLRDPLTTPFKFPPVCSLNPRVSREVEAAIAKAVEPHKSKRHQSTEEMRTALLGNGTVKRRRPPAKGKRKPASPAARPPSVPGKLASTPASLDFGAVPAGGGAPAQSLAITLPAGERATLSTDVPWLHVRPQSVSKSGSQVTVTLNTTRLKPGRLQLRGGWLKRWIGWHTRIFVPAKQDVHAHVEMELKDGSRQRVLVSVTVGPQPLLVLIGWMVTIGAMLVEAAFVVGALGILVIVMLLGI